MEIASPSANKLFPVFLKLEELRLLIIGGGNIGLEKLQAVLNNSPATRIRVVAETIQDRINALAETYPNITLVQKLYESSDLDGADMVIAAVNDLVLCGRIRSDAHKRRLLVNIADTPQLCDFYLGSIVSKGNLKIAISTNGTSPTMARRMKEVLNDMIPEEMDHVL
ncbi:MAG TPA: bifunctional precorrin-2 dehydrogenase/sirohydrochlorin ferrochelatase [Sediminibacterium sp.]